MYGHLFKDTTGHYLFIKSLGIGVSCQSQLVLHCETGELRVRKVLHRRVPLAQRNRTNGTGGNRMEQPEVEFCNDVRIAKFLASRALQAGVNLRMPKVLSASTITDQRSGKYSRVSYWSLCNGGSLSSFAHNCWDKAFNMPEGLVLRFLQHALEMLHFMYATLPDPLFHGDLHSNNVLLHFPPGCNVPDFHLIDFGQARPAAYLARDPTLSWDIPDLLRILETDLAKLTLPLETWPNLNNNNKDDNDNDNVPSYLLNHLLNKDSPLCTAYRMLRALAATFDANRRARAAAATTSRPGPSSLSTTTTIIPDLRPVLSYVRDQAMRALPDLLLAGDWRQCNSLDAGAAVAGAEARYGGIRPLRPALYRSVGEILAARNVPGPWCVAVVREEEEEEGGGGTGVVEVVEIVAVGGREALHRPNEENDASVTDSAWCGSQE
ncbi:hypothetical protein VTK56DRAFT_5765 [Thermocarpiscus australiensis]